MDDYRSKFYHSYVSSHLRAGPAELRERIDKQERYYVSLINKYFPTDREATVIDLGCGHGTLVHYARRMGYRHARGVDASAEQVRAAEALGIEGVAEGNALEALRAAEPASVDVVTAIDILEHMTKLESLEFVSEVRRALKPSGRFLVHAPNAGSPFFGTIRYGDYTHEQAFTSSSITQLLTACGFARVTCYEDTPIAYGPRSWARLVLWKALRAAMSAYIAVETGSTRERLFTQNFLTVGYASASD